MQRKPSGLRARSRHKDLVNGLKSESGQSSATGASPWHSLIPFVALAPLGLISAAFAPGPDEPIFFSAAFFLVAALLIAFPLTGLPGRWAIPACIYVGSVGCLMLADDGIVSGLAVLMLIPIVVVALCGDRWESVLVVGTVPVVLAAVALNSRFSADNDARRIIIFVAIGVIISVAIHDLRGRLLRLQAELAQRVASDERRRIARELHDGLAHELAYIASKVHSSARDTAGIEIDLIASAADRALDEARRAITVLSSVNPEPLHRGLAQTAEDIGSRLGVNVTMDLDEQVDTPESVTENLLRIVREAMTNAATHGNPNEVKICLEGNPGMRLVIEDDGSGFDPTKGEGSSGFGLISMQERAAAVGARFNISSAPSRGTQIEVVIP